MTTSDHRILEMLQAMDVRLTALADRMPVLPAAAPLKDDKGWPEGMRDAYGDQEAPPFVWLERAEAWERAVKYDRHARRQGAPNMTAMAMAGEIVDAMKHDTSEAGGGCDLTAGMFGPAMTELLRSWAEVFTAATVDAARLADPKDKAS